ncbi:uncharacterized protein [Linepithema humile]|uniref:uncharacterized protein n=1 Tax=Linepithema humile TaxID=83485 RepID=UPI00351EC062
MPRLYSNSEYADMVYLYGFCDGNANAARREYSAPFPNRRLPNKFVFSSTFQRLKETGSFNMVPRADGVFAPLQNERRTAIILQHFDQNPSTSVRRSGCELGISSTIIWKTLPANGRYPYHFQRVQYLLPADMARRRVFCDWFLNQTNNDPHFLFGDLAFSKISVSINAQLFDSTIWAATSWRRLTEDLGVILQSLPFSKIAYKNLHATNNDKKTLSATEHFSQNILWTDEAIFTRHGILNQGNSHVWSLENPRAIREQHFQHNFQCNVWLGIIDNTLIGPHVLSVRLNANGFLEFLNHEFCDLFEDIPLNIRMNSWFQLDGCPAHYGKSPRQWLNIHFLRRWIGRAGPVAWPPRSPDLTPLDFFCMGYA